MKAAFLFGFGILILTGFSSCNSKQKKAQEECNATPLQIETPASVEMGRIFKLSAKLGTRKSYTYANSWIDGYNTTLNSGLRNAEPAEYIFYRSDEPGFLSVNTMVDGCTEVKTARTEFQLVMPAPPCTLPPNSFRFDTDPADSGLTVSTVQMGPNHILYAYPSGGSLSVIFESAPSTGVYIAYNSFDPSFSPYVKVKRALAGFKVTIDGETYYPVREPGEYPTGNIYLYDYNNGKRALMACDLPVQLAGTSPPRLVSFHFLMD